ncbi:hypothetical protein M409DRAFT_63835 [Zasmidium cellare ATCC 36951]|uniref:OPT superfamily oligopeptide transporter n=1 Tax=Zasmidium cellare ATCC 36951 TaxID=1080233 RepID=A0A6A6CUN6_ZASCE|nr:uncharacterized protein M409DRAFT_63835 [Zasmidium cellare ATCC 36951]KAF2170765.1 hypothetical protein M409DRAFT_63835 [Zasmidium cellare ATCC 36951]
MSGSSVVDSAATPISGTFVSFRAIAAGCVIGILTNLSNTYYGLQTGYSNQGDLTASLLGFAVFKALSRVFRIRELSIHENVLITSASTAAGCMPVTAGFTNTIPALEFVIKRTDGGPVVFSWLQLTLWSFGLAFFGLIFASVLHDRLIVRENLPWPGAKAFAASLDVLYNRMPVQLPRGRRISEQTTLTAQAGETRHDEDPAKANDQDWLNRFRLLFMAGSIGMVITILMYFVPISRRLPVLGSYLAKNYLWTASISPGYFGGGIITGPVISLHMLAGAIFGWGILASISKSHGWANGPADDWETGIRGWVTWVSLAALMADTVVKLGSYIIEAFTTSFPRKRIETLRLSPGPVARTPLWPTGRRHSSQDTPGIRDRLLGDHSSTLESTDESRNQSVAAKGQKNLGQSLKVTKSVGLAFLVSILVCCFAITFLIKAMRWYLVLLAVLLSLPMAYVGIRVLAETDFNPQSGLVSQLVFAVILTGNNPSAILLNVVAAGVATAGSSQAGDLAYDFKIGHDVGVPPKSQLYAQIVGSVFGAFISTGIYRLYTSTYQMPSTLFPLPASLLDVTRAKLLHGRGLPPGAGQYAIGVGIFFLVTSCVKIVYANRWWQNLIPNATSFAIGIFLVPSFTISRAVGGILFWYLVHVRHMQRDPILVVGSGLVLGESLGSVVNLLLEASRVPTL